MRNINILLIVMMGFCIVLAACGKGAVDTRALEKSFAKGPDAIKMHVEKAVEAVNAGRYSEAMASLSALADSPLLSKEQQNAVKDVVSQLGAVAGKEGTVTLDNIKNSLKPTDN